MKSRKSLGEKYYLHSIITSLVLFLFYLLGVNTSYLNSSILNYSTVLQDPFDGSVYPISFLPNPATFTIDQKQLPFQQFDSKDFISLPRYDPKIFGRNVEGMPESSSEYKETMLQKNIYTVPYLGNYLFDGKEYVGSHPGVDIIAPMDTPVVCIANGVITQVGYQNTGFGNFVVVRHSGIEYGGKMLTVYSVYAHLNKVSVEEGKKIAKGAYIGFVGKTGIATTNHLHFQIDTEASHFHPYWPFSGDDMQKAGVGFFDAVNIGLGNNEALSHTMHPFNFIHSTLNVSLPQPLAKVSDPPVVVHEVPIISSGTNLLPKQPISTPETQPQGDPQTLTGTSNTGGIVKREERIQKDLEIVGEDDLLLRDNMEVVMLGRPDLLLGIEGAQRLTQTQSTLPPSASSGTLKPNPNVEIINSEEEVSTGTVIDPPVAIEPPQVGLYQDISSDYRYYQALESLTQRGILHGFADNTFRPNLPVTRAESLKMIFSIAGVPIIKDRDSVFVDIPKNSWENAYINTGIDRGMVTQENRSFRPTDMVTRAELMKLVVTLSKKNLKLSPQTLIQDVDPRDWWYQYMLMAQRLKWFEVRDGRIFPNQPVTREEMLLILSELSK